MLKQVKLSEVKPDPKQPRQEFDPSQLLRLRNSIETYGIMNPIIVEKTKGGYLIIDGERRYRAAKSLDLREVPVLITDEQDYDERLKKRFNLQEQHSGWTAFDKAKAVQDLQVRTNMNMKEIANALGLSGATVNDYLSLLNLTKRTIQYAEDKKLPLAYLTAVGQTAKKIEDDGLRSKYEASIIDRIEDGEIKKYSQINEISRALVVGGDELVKKIVKNKEFTLKQALKETKQDAELMKRRLITTLGYMRNIAALCIRSGGNKVFTEAQQKSLEQTITSLKKLNDVVEVVEEDDE